ncbi:MAG: redoxin domain-containing protein [Bacteroidales bacterium]|nr:redoxin domain-containing protein [Bacteroidales bacterium]
MNLKRLFYTILITGSVLSCAIAEKGHNIEVKVTGLQDTISMLAYHFGNRQYIQDTVRIDQDGRFRFQGEERLDPGMYMIVLPDQKYFEVIVDHNQHFRIETEMDNFINTMKFENSQDNEIFYDYMRLIGRENEVIGPARAELQDPSTTPERQAELRSKLAEADAKVKSLQDEIINQSPDGLFARILMAQKEPPMPEAPLKEDGTPDNDYMYQVYKRNFWNNIDFSDDRILRTPVFHAKLNQFFTRVLMQIPDSIIVEADRLVEKSRAHPEMFKYVVFFVTNTFERSQIMGMDAVFVHMVEDYYMTGEADWVTPEQLERISERAMALKPLLIGKIAPDITMFAPDRKPLSLHDVDARFTVLYFWDSECSHCKRQTPLMKKFYEKLHPKGVEIFAANTEADRNKWLDYIKANGLEWIHVNDPVNSSGFRDKYDIWATPLIFLLDEDKRIIAKRITVEQAEEIINRELTN